MHLAVLRVQAPDVGARPQAEIGVVALGFVNPLPAQVLAEVNVELPNAAVLFRGAAGRREGGTRVRRAEGLALLPRVCMCFTLVARQHGLHLGLPCKPCDDNSNKSNSNDHH